MSSGSPPPLQYLLMICDVWIIFEKAVKLKSTIGILNVIASELLLPILVKVKWWVSNATSNISIFKESETNPTAGAINILDRRIRAPILALAISEKIKSSKKIKINFFKISLLSKPLIHTKQIHQILW